LLIAGFQLVLIYILKRRGTFLLKHLKKGFAVLTTAFMLTSILPGFAFGVTTDPVEMNKLFKGKFASSSTTVPRIAGIDRFETAAKIAQQGWEDGSSEYAVLSAGMDENLVDALTAAPLASIMDAPILLTEGESLNAFAKAELERLEVTTVYVTSGTGIIKQPVLDELQQMDIEVVNLGGLNRYQTAINIAKEIGDFDQIVVSTAWSNADALSVASLAAYQGIPILLSDVDKLPSELVSYLSPLTSQIEKTYVLGGVGALSETVEKALPHPTRLGGKDRYATNMAILEAFMGAIELEKVYVASGNDGNLVDALAGSSLAAQTASAMVLVDKAGLSSETRSFVKDKIFPVYPDNMIALGGETIVPTSMVQELTSVMKYTQDKMSVGSSSGERLQFDENLVVLGNEVTLSNLTTPFNVYVEGDGTTLQDVHAETVILNPGESGKAILKNVNAEMIVVLSGAVDGIVLENSMAKGVLVMSPNKAGVILKGNSTIDATIIMSDAVLDAQSGNFGDVIAGNPLQLIPNLELKGVFTKPVILSDGSVSTGSGTTVPSLVIAPADGKEKIMIQGNFGVVQVVRTGIISIESGSAVDSLMSVPDAEISIQEGAVVRSRNSL
jgi:putative cell wall-binding protein